jgi:hypothetical protein
MLFIRQISREPTCQFKQPSYTKKIPEWETCTGAAAKTAARIGRKRHHFGIFFAGTARVFVSAKRGLSRSMLPTQRNQFP